MSDPFSALHEYPLIATCRRGQAMGDFQQELRFDKPNPGDGYANWLAVRRAAARELAQKLGLPLEHQVEVWLTDEVRLRGKLRLEEQVLFVQAGRERHLRLVVGNTPFAYGEMRSCVRMDEAK